MVLLQSLYKSLWYPELVEEELKHIGLLCIQHRVLTNGQERFKWSLALIL